MKLDSHAAQAAAARVGPPHMGGSAGPGTSEASARAAASPPLAEASARGELAPAAPAAEPLTPVGQQVALQPPLQENYRASYSDYGGSSDSSRSSSLGSSPGERMHNPFEVSRDRARPGLEGEGRADEADSLPPWEHSPSRTLCGPSSLGPSELRTGSLTLNLTSSSSDGDLSPRHGSPVDAAGQARLTRSLFEQLESIGQEGRDIKIFHFISQQDPHTVSDLRRAAQWVADHPGGVGRVSPEGLEGRWPDEMDRLPKLAIALGLERLRLSGRLGMPTFEHEDTGLLLGQVRTHLDACLAQAPHHGRQPLQHLQERLMRDLVGAVGPQPTQAMHALRLSVEELAVRPRHNQRDYVAMAIELALDPAHAVENGP